MRSWWVERPATQARTLGEASRATMFAAPSADRRPPCAARTRPTDSMMVRRIGAHPPPDGGPMQDTSRWLSAAPHPSRRLNLNALVPAKIEDVDPPYGFARTQTANLTGWAPGVAHPGMAGLVSASTVRISASNGLPSAGVKATVPSSSTLPPPPPKTDPPAAKPDRTAVRVACIAGLATITAAWIGLRSDETVKADVRPIDPIVTDPAPKQVLARPPLTAPAPPPVASSPISQSPPAAGPVLLAETTTGAEQPSGRCGDFSGQYSFCTPVKPAGWTINYDLPHTIGLSGDRSCGAYSTCSIAESGPTRMCTAFTLQGHDEECGQHGNTGIHYTKPVLTVVWSHPAP